MDFNRKIFNTVVVSWMYPPKNNFPEIPEFKLPLLPCVRRAKNLRDRLVKADMGSKTIVSKQNFLQTQKQGTFPCLNCFQCNNVQKGPKVFHPHSGQGIPIKGYYTCEASYVVYLIKCTCGLAYVGKMTQTFRDRISQHKSTICCKKNSSAPTLPLNIVLEQIDPNRRGQNK
ncbi:unnamed protein product [Ranitomeya imitator]|uniref:GIY-YIG domain-containing protein n=1 Tax=Ranitomeya imitator TaxID=111125 RepID=A0ABN9LRT4_9NEOB|nr:unnamed protein product [Ranitomeya imitator]